MTVVIAALRQSMGFSGALVACPGSVSSGTRTPQGSTVKITTHQMMM